MDSMQRLIDADAISRLAAHDASLYTDEIDVRQTITQRLGWTDLAERAPQRTPLVKTLAKALVDEGATDIVLLGMGGSSLAALTMSLILGSSDSMPRLHVLDTTNPVDVNRLLRELKRESTFFLISSKSGSTIEPLSLYAIFRKWMEEDLPRPAAGKHFIAVTDPKSKLEALRASDLMRLTINTPPAVGGRFSALTLFGLTPAALIGIDVDLLTQRALRMEKRCHKSGEDNPGAKLAAFIGDAWAVQCNKLTLVTSEGLEPFGLWVEQLVAESTGKLGTGMIPVLETAASTPSGYGEDRAVVVMRFADDKKLSAWAETAAREHRVIELTLDDAYDIGAEFVRWEHAIALTGVLLDINPFDEPNVAEAKQATNDVLSGARKAPVALTDLDGVWVTYDGSLAGTPAPDDLTSAVAPLLQSLEPGDYLTTLAYLPNDEALFGHLSNALKRVSAEKQVATCLATGPRYLHSTGQLHKGGPRSGVFLVITARDRADVEIPGQSFSLARLFRAQAEGDLITLAAHGLRVMRLDLASSDCGSVAAVGAALVAASRN